MDHLRCNSKLHPEGSFAGLLTLNRDFFLPPYCSQLWARCPVLAGDDIYNYLMRIGFYTAAKQQVGNVFASPDHSFAVLKPGSRFRKLSAKVDSGATAAKHFKR